MPKSPRALALPLAAAAAAAALAALFVSEGAYRQSVRALDELGAAAEARATVVQLQQSLIEGAPPRVAAAAFARLGERYAAQAAPALLLGRLQAVAGHADQVGGSLAAADVRTLSTELLAWEDGRVADHRDALTRTLRLAYGVVAGLGIVSLLALGLALRQSAQRRRTQGALEQVAAAERERLEVEVRRRTAQLTELTLHLQTAREDERHRLARNLHDELGALLTAAKLDAARIRSRLGDTAPEASARLVHLVQTLDASIALGRSIIEDLRPSTLAHLGLVPALEILLREFGEASGLAVECTLEPVALDADAELTVYRCVQEALTNIGKHARARRIGVTMAPRDGCVVLTLHDDGVGFDPALPRRSAHGLVGMTFRVEAAGGRLSVASAPGNGTRLTLTLPRCPGAAA